MPMVCWPASDRRLAEGCVGKPARHWS